METKKGVCKNLFECEKADSKEIITVDVNKPFVCPECGKNLEAIEDTGSKGGMPMKKVGIIGAIVLLLGGGGAAAYFLLGNSEKAPDSIRFLQTELTLNVGETKTAPVKITPPGLETTPLTWSSDDEAIASVANGSITGKAEGQTTIYAATPNNLKASVNVTVASTTGAIEPETTEPETTETTPEATDPAPSQGTPKETTTPATSGTVSVSGGSYSGELKNGKPHGMGTVKYSSRTLISKRDAKQRYAESGDYITGEFYNGELVQGNWYNKNNEQKEKLLLGRPQ